MCPVAQIVAAATVVVAPLHDASPNSDADTGQGVADLVGGLLADHVTVVSGEKLDDMLKEQGLSVRGLTDARTAVKVGKLLKADFVLSGSVFRRDNRIEFAVQLFDVASGAVVKGVSADGAADALFHTASVLAARCAEALKVAPPKVAAKTVGVTHLAQEQNFLKALGCYYAGDYDRAIMHCLKVIELDPNDLRARLRLAESFLASGEAGQAKITIFRTLQLFPATALTPRVESLLDRLDPAALQAVEKQPCAIALPSGWPADASVSYELTWKGQPARRDTKKAERSVLTLEMPGARVPLDLRLVMSAEGRESAVRHIRLWPADAGIRQPETKLVVVDPTQQFTGLLKNIKFKHYTSLKTVPPKDHRAVVAPAATAKMTREQARRLDEFIASGGQLVLVGQCPAEIDLAGIRRASIQWPIAAVWTERHGGAAAWTFLLSKDVVAAASRMSLVLGLRGGTPWLWSAERNVSLIAGAARGKGRLLWIAWPAKWDAKDPRCARVLALAVSDAVARQPAD